MKRFFEIVALVETSVTLSGFSMSLVCKVNVVS